jgi:putative membrane protein insertion efficiency factor
MSSTLSLAQRAALALVGAYRVTLKPLLPAACRFEPSCSEYAAQAIRAHGAGRGARLALARLLRCRPCGGGGLDPVPPPRG